MKRPSVFEAAGGAEAFLALATAHHLRCLADPMLEHPFSHPGHPDHIARLAAYWGEVLGGPPAYSAVGGSEPAMLHIHARNDAPAEMGARFTACFVAAMDDAGLPDDPELRACLRAYMEWAEGQVMAYAPKAAVVPGDATIPRWSWDCLQA